MSYPTKKEIMSKPVKFRKAVIQTLQQWKNTCWPKPNLAEIEALLVKLSYIYEKPLGSITKGPRACYIPTAKKIYLKNLSLITALHEFGHHLYGSSEKTACRWSIWLFKQVFPKDFLKLTWKGHMLCQT